MGKLRLAPDYPKPLAAKPLPLHLPTQDVIDLPEMVQVVCRFQADERLDCLPFAYLVDSIALTHRTYQGCARIEPQQLR